MARRLSAGSSDEPLRHRPRLQHAVAFEAQVVVQARRAHAAGRRRAAARCRASTAGRRLRRGVEGALGGYSLRLLSPWPDSRARRTRHEVMRILRRRERLFLQGMEGHLLSRQDEAGGDAARSTPTRLPTVEINNTFYRMPQARRCSRTGRRTTPEAFRFSIKASRRITHIARLKAETVTEPLGYLYDKLAALGDKRGPVLFQLPPNLKKDLPRLEAFPGAAARRSSRARSSSATTPGSPTTCTRRCEAPAPRSCLSEREDNAPPPLVETAPWGYVRLRLENYSDADLAQWAKRLAATGWKRDLRRTSCTSRPRPPTPAALMEVASLARS